MRVRSRRTPALFAALVLCIAGSGCRSVGPKTVARDRFDYGTAVRQSWEEQLLLNMVGIRYGRAPSFIDVTSIINQYSLEGQASAGVGFNNSLLGENTGTIGGATRWADRPTVTYSPVRGQEFTRNLLTPVPPAALFSLVESGWPAQLVFGLAAKSINGLRNQTGRLADTAGVAEDFYVLLEAWDRVNQSHAIGVRKRVDPDGNAYVITFEARGLNEQLRGDLEYLREALELREETGEIRLTYGNAARSDDEIAVLSSSILDMMILMSRYFDLPPEHVEEQRAYPPLELPSARSAPFVRVHHSLEEPEDAFVSVQTRGYWFYIDDRDLESKRVFSVMLIFLSLAETGEGSAGPTVTIGQ